MLILKRFLLERWWSKVLEISSSIIIRWDSYFATSYHMCELLSCLPSIKLIQLSWFFSHINLKVMTVIFQLRICLLLRRLSWWLQRAVFLITPVAWVSNLSADIKWCSKRMDWHLRSNDRLFIQYHLLQVILVWQYTRFNAKSFWLLLWCRNCFDGCFVRMLIIHEVMLLFISFEIW